MSSPKVDVIEAADGAQALRLAREKLPDLVVLDVMMPEMSGWEVCKKIREDVSLAHTGVVMLTGIGENLNMMTSPLYGADAYIDKPFEFDALDTKVRSALAARARQRGAVPRTPVNGVAGAARAAPKKAKATATKIAKAAAKGIAKAATKVAKAAEKVVASKKKAPAKKAAAKSIARAAAKVAKAAAKVAKVTKKKPAKVAKKAPKKAPKKPAKRGAEEGRQEGSTPKRKAAKKR